jgi:hypothetical protein
MASLDAEAEAARAGKGASLTAYLTDVLTRLVNNWPNRRLGELLPWIWTPEAT